VDAGAGGRGRRRQRPLRRKWVGRYLLEGYVDLRDRSSAPHRIPRRTSSRAWRRSLRCAGCRATAGRSPRERPTIWRRGRVRSLLPPNRSRACDRLGDVPHPGVGRRPMPPHDWVRLDAERPARGESQGARRSGCSALLSDRTARASFAEEDRAQRAAVSPRVPLGRRRGSERGRASGVRTARTPAAASSASDRV
jgi:hypothetical protein